MPPFPTDACPHRRAVPADAPPPRAAAAGPPADAAPPCYTSVQLFGAGREIEIVHGGSRYRLSRTSTGKLILTK